MKFLYFIGAFLCISHTSFSAEPSVTVLPALLDYWLLEASPFKLDCVYKYSGSAEVPIFYKNDKNDKNDTILTKETPGLNYSTSAGVISGTTTISTITITKPAATMSDSGKYVCKLQQTSSYINVHVFTATTEDAVLVEGAPTVSLKCDVVGVDSANYPDIKWIRNNTTLVDGTEYKIHEANRTLEIIKPERADIGEYFCEMVFNADTNLAHSVVPQAVALKAEPKIDSHDKNKNYVQGDQLDLKCMVSGYPTPKVTWKKDGVLFNTSHRIHLFPYGPSPTGKLTIYSLEFEDKGIYSCEAWSEEFNTTDKVEMKIRVKDKLAALWPFLGIVAEVIVLCVIILIYEKKRSKRLAAEEDDSTDANVENTVDNKDVRHRRT